MVDPAMVEMAAKAAFPKVFKLPRINLNKRAYETAYESTTAALAAVLPAVRRAEREKAARYMETTLPHLSLQEYAAAIRTMEDES